MRVPYGPIRTDPVRQVPARIRDADEAAELLASWLTRHKSQTKAGADGMALRGVAMLTGAGVSVDSGIPDYRGEQGTYTINKTYRPIFYNEFRDNHRARQRYWARSFLGYPPVMNARPNAIHDAVAALMTAGFVHTTVTQNVDGLHTYGHNTDSSLASRVVELHGSLHDVVCLSCGHSVSRRSLQDELRRLNSAWRFLEAPLHEDLDGKSLSRDEAREATRRSISKQAAIRTNPDGDVDLPGNAGVHYEDFRYPACPHCLAASRSHSHQHTIKAISPFYADALAAPRIASPTAKPFADTSTSRVLDAASVDVSVDDEGAWMSGGSGVLKPSVVFFGESVPHSRKSAADAALMDSDTSGGRSGLLCMGTSLAVYSAYRLVKAMRAQGGSIGVLSKGHVRDEEKWLSTEEHSMDLRVNMMAGDVLPKVVQLLNIDRG
ncbi:hypothetical protein PYCC9005_003854 [Savitreella phatthalungensis]